MANHLILVALFTASLLCGCSESTPKSKGKGKVAASDNAEGEGKIEADFPSAPSGPKPSKESKAKKDPKSNSSSNAKRDALAGLDPEVIAKLTPAQIEAIRNLDPETLKAMTADELQAFLDRNAGGETGALTQDQRVALTTALLGVVTTVIQSGIESTDDDEDYYDDCEDCDEGY